MSETLRTTIEAHRERAVALLSALVQRPTENPPGDTGEAMEWLANWLGEQGLEVERHPVPAPFARNFHRSDIENLLVRHTFGPGPTIALHAPIDTLPAGSAWRREPFEAEVRDGMLIGLGARDSKADVAAYVAALLALKEVGIEAGTVELHITADEESGGFLGPAFLLGHGLTAPDAVIGAGTAYQVITGQQGVLHLEVVLRGRQAHASRPQDGRDAIMAGLPILTALTDHSLKIAQPLTVTTASGGRGVNVVADRFTLTIDRRIDAGEDGDLVEAELMALVEAAHGDARPDGVSVECRRLLLAEPVRPTPQSERLAQTLSRQAQAVFEREVPVVSAPVVSGARHYALAGIATALYGVGPPIVGEGVDFLGDETVSLADLEKATLVIARAVEALTKGEAAAPTG